MGCLTYPGKRFSPRDEGERARYGAYAIYRRAAEAVTVRALADELLEDKGDERDVIVLGDLNDEPHAATTQILHGPPGSEIGTAGHARPDLGDPARLFNVAPHIPEKERYSRIHAGRKELIDHILVSHALLDRIEEAGTGPERGKLPSVGQKPPTERRDTPGSDHAPVWTRLSS
jgi:predicted extracellular nuclease